KLQGLKLNAEHFIEVMERNDEEACFEYKYNPFKKDVEGKTIEFDEGFKISDSLYLRPDLSTLKDAAFLKSEAIVFADVYDSENKNMVPYAPRTIMKNTLK